MIHVVMGPPCAGKSTFVANNAPAGAPRFDFDLLAATVGGTDFKHVIPQPVADAVLAMRRGVMGWLLDVETVIDEFWLINSAPSPDTIARLDALGATFHMIDPGIDECIARAQRDGWPPDTVDKIRGWYANPPVIPGAEPKKGDTVKFKNFVADVKAPGDTQAGDTTAPAGRIVAYASVFDVVDSYGDMMRRGAFADTLKEWSDSGKTIPLLYGHDFRDPFKNIGGVVDAVEDDHGLKITADLDMDNATAVQVYNLVKAGRLSELSFGFNYRDASTSTVDGEEVFEVRSVDLFEVSIVPIGANRETGIVDVKAATDFLTAVKQAITDEDVLSTIADALGVKDTPSEKSSPVTSGGVDSEARARLARAQISIMERMG